MGKGRVAAIAVALGALAACGLSVSGEAASDGGVDRDAAIDGPAREADVDGGDASFPIADGATDVDSGPGSDCTSFASGLADFTHSGPGTMTTLAGDGVELTFSAGVTNALSKTYTAAAPYTTTIVDIDMRGSFNGTWGGGGSDYIPLIRHYFGATQTVTTSSLVEHALAQFGVDLDIFSPTGLSHRLDTLALPPPTTTRHRVTTKWSTSGSVLTEQGAVKQSFDYKTAEASMFPNTKLTLVLGGTPSGMLPISRVVFQTVCVTFEP